MSSQTTVTASYSEEQLKLVKIACGFYLPKALYVFAEYRIADLLVDGPKTAEALAEEAGLHADTLYRTLRALASEGVLDESESREFSLNNVGRLLVSGHPSGVREGALCFTGPMAWKSWEGYHDALRTGGVGMEIAHGMSYYEYLERHPEESENFNRGMVAVSSQGFDRLPSTYDFTGMKEIVDVGGGIGALLTAVVRATPGLRGILFDLPYVAADAEKVIAQDGMSERISVVGGSYFDDEIPRGADAYVLAGVIHNRSDDESIAILKNIAAAAEPGAKVLIVDMVVPEGPGADFRKLQDLTMMVEVGGRERTAGEFEALFDASGFALGEIALLEMPLSVTEGIRVG
jgi:hypothetical protein